MEFHMAFKGHLWNGSAGLCVWKGYFERHLCLEMDGLPPTNAPAECKICVSLTPCLSKTPLTCVNGLGPTSTEVKISKCGTPVCRPGDLLRLITGHWRMEWVIDQPGSEYRRKEESVVPTLPGSSIWDRVWCKMLKTGKVWNPLYADYVNQYFTQKETGS